MANLTRRDILRTGAVAAGGLAFGSAALAKTSGVASAFNFPPLAICVDQTVREDFPGAGFATGVSIDGGSCDFDGTTCSRDAVRVRQFPGTESRFPLGTTPTTLRVVDAQGATDSCTADIVAYPFDPIVKLSARPAVIDEGEIGYIDTDETTYSPGLDALRWSWSQTNGPTAVILNGGFQLSYRSPAVSEPTEITFEATAVDKRYEGSEQFEETGSITITVKPVIIPVDIDIQPDDEVNSIPKGGKIPVALFGSEDFDPTKDVLTSSIRFGSEATVSNGGGSTAAKTTTADVNNDGIRDLLLIFPVRGTGFAPGDTVGKLTGQTPEDYDIVGTDTVSVPA